MLKKQRIRIADIYVPVKRRQTLDAQKVEAIAHAVMKDGLIVPIMLRPDGARFVLIEGLHRLEACRALGEEEIDAFIVQPRRH